MYTAKYKFNNIENNFFVLTNINFQRHEKLNSTNIHIYVHIYVNRLTKYKNDQNKFTSCSFSNKYSNQCTSV